jgi:hypothetical protein
LFFLNVYIHVYFPRESRSFSDLKPKWALSKRSGYNHMLTIKYFWWKICLVSPKCSQRKKSKYIKDFQIKLSITNDLDSH